MTLRESTRLCSHRWRQYVFRPEEACQGSHTAGVHAVALRHISCISAYLGSTFLEPGRISAPKLTALYRKPSMSTCGWSDSQPEWGRAEARRRRLGPTRRPAGKIRRMLRRLRCVVACNLFSKLVAAAGAGGAGRWDARTSGRVGVWGFAFGCHPPRFPPRPIPRLRTRFPLPTLHTAVRPRLARPPWRLPSHPTPLTTPHTDSPRATPQCSPPPTRNRRPPTPTFRKDLGFGIQD